MLKILRLLLLFRGSTGCKLTLDCLGTRTILLIGDCGWIKMLLSLQTSYNYGLVPRVCGMVKGQDTPVTLIRNATQLQNKSP